MRRKAAIQLAQAYTLLRINKIKEAQKSIDEVLDIKLKTLDYDKIYIAFAISSEINIRLGNFDKAFKDAEKAIKLLKKSHSNLKKLTKVVCCYNLAIIEHAKHNNNASVEYFKEFFESADKFCETFLNKTVYIDLKNREVFKCSDNIQDCLQNSYRIFIAICGADHSFIRNYVVKNH